MTDFADKKQVIVEMSSVLIKYSVSYSHIILIN